MEVTGTVEGPSKEKRRNYRLYKLDMEHVGCISAGYPMNACGSTRYKKVVQIESWQDEKKLLGIPDTVLVIPYQFDESTSELFFNTEESHKETDLGLNIAYHETGELSSKTEEKKNVKKWYTSCLFSIRRE
ncbi:MAG: hypothetical protein N2513_03250 [Deltaproteobacteria bacterium]|nr:hypothetical protein [Deltaproteobacteria bacterium]